MKVFLVRHGIAADSGPDGSDAQRPLTAAGIAELREEAAGLDRLDVRWDVILTSPLLRARQTAAALASHLEGKPPVAVSSALAPSGTMADVAAALHRYPEHSRVALVGHEPGIGILAARWLGIPAPISFKKGSVCRIDFEATLDDAGGTLRWFATPRMLRLMGRPERK